MASAEVPPGDAQAPVPGSRRLSRRVRTLIVAGVLFVVLFALVFTLPVPYVILSPGPTYNTIGSVATTNGKQTDIIKVTGASVRKTSGNLNLTTVGVDTQAVTAFEAFTGWLKHDEVVVPRSAVYPPGQSQQQTDQQNTQDFVVSQDNATAAATCELGYPRGFGVIGTVADGPSRGKLLHGDRFVTIDGKDATSAAKLRSVLDAERQGTTVPLRVVRGGKTITVPITLGAPPKGAKGAGLGVTVSNTCLAPFSVDLALANQIGGPSAGLMFALGILDKVGPVDLTKGRFVAGTGTIDPDGTVGPIGGIQLKMIAARDKGATVFLAPAGNCGDVRGNIPSGLKVVKVTTLHDAVQDLKNIETGSAVPSC